MFKAGLVRSKESFCDNILYGTYCDESNNNIRPYKYRKSKNLCWLNSYFR